MATAYLSKTFAQAGNRRTFTISYWIKMNGSTSSNPGILDAGADGSNSDDLYLHTGRLNFSGYYGSTQYQVRTNAKYVDTSGWYHHVIRFDTTQSTASDRLRLYVNGEVQTDLANNTYPSQNFQTTYMNTARLHTIGSFAIGSLPNTPFDGQMAHFHFTDGYSYAASTFGETDVTTGIWKPKVSPSVTYGTNGFFLKFDNSANMGLDSSGQGNNWTTNGTIIQNKDTPSNVFACLNPLSRPTSSGNNTFSNVNSEMTNSADAFRTTFATLGTAKGKYYWEAKFLSGEMKQMIGVSKPHETMDFVGQSSGSWGWQNENARRYNNNSYTSYGSTASSGDIIMVAFDATNGAIWVGKNGTWFNSATQSEIEAGTVTNAMFSSITIDDYFLPAFTTEDSNIQVNFGNGYFGATAVSSAQNPSDGVGIFEYSVPAGYKALCTKSINAQEYS